LPVEDQCDEQETEPVRSPSRASSNASSTYDKSARVLCSRCENPVFIPLSNLKNKTLPIQQCCGVPVAFVKKCTTCPRFFFQAYGTRTMTCYKCSN
jgi:hypothetical protein